MSSGSSAAQAVEVRAVGTVTDGTALEELTQLLVALSGAQPTPLHQLEVVLRPPAAAPEGGSSVPAGWKPDLRLLHDLPPPSASSSTAAAAAADGDRWAAGRWQPRRVMEGSEGSCMRRLYQCMPGPTAALLLKHQPAPLPLLPSPRTRARTHERRWEVLQFSLHMRGKQYAGLAATVRHVTRTSCAGGDVPAFWCALGFAPRFQLLRRGSRFWVPLGGQEVEVTLSRVLRLPAPTAAAGGGAGRGAAGGTAGGAAGGSGGAALDAAALQRAEEVSPGRLLVEAVAHVPADADPLDSAAAVGQLAALLQPHTALQRPPRAPGEPA